MGNRRRRTRGLASSSDNERTNDERPNYTFLKPKSVDCTLSIEIFKECYCAFISIKYYFINRVNSSKISKMELEIRNDGMIRMIRSFRFVSLRPKHSFLPSFLPVLSLSHNVCVHLFFHFRPFFHLFTWWVGWLVGRSVGRLVGRLVVGSFDRAFLASWLRGFFVVVLLFVCCVHLFVVAKWRHLVVPYCDAYLRYSVAQYFPHGYKSLWAAWSSLKLAMPCHAVVYSSITCFREHTASDAKLVVVVCQLWYALSGMKLQED